MNCKDIKPAEFQWNLDRVILEALPGPFNFNDDNLIVTEGTKEDPRVELQNVWWD